MYTTYLPVLAFCLLLGHREIHASVTFPVEGSGISRNTSDSSKSKGEGNDGRVTEKIVVTKDREARNAWLTTDQGNLASPQHTAVSTSGRSGVYSPENQIVPTSGTAFEGRPSQRMKRTFWPFSSLFGYDEFDYPPPFYGPGMPGMFRPGMGMPPFGGGFGGGLGMGYPGPFGPPPPLGLGLGFTLGL